MKSLFIMLSICFLLHSLQCDQMARLVLQYWALYSNELLPISIINCQSMFTILPNIKWTFKKLPYTFKFCQSGEISQHLVTLILSLTGRLDDWARLTSIFYNRTRRDKIWKLTVSVCPSPSVVDVIKLFWGNVENLHFPLGEETKMSSFKNN